MKLEVGLYFRTKGGTIGKIDSIAEDGTEIYFDTKPIFRDEEFGSKWCYATDIIKVSHNIINLIKVGDYINGKEVTCVTGNNYIELDYGCNMVGCNNEDIKTILTKEQMEANQYVIK